MNVAYNEDCIQGMKRYPDKYFDLAVVDPPYGGSQTVNVERERETETPPGCIKPTEEGSEVCSAHIISVDRTGRTWQKKYQPTGRPI